MSTNVTSAAQFTKALQDSKKIVVAKFYLTWCPHCQNIEQPYEMLARQSRASGRVKFLNVDMEKLPELADALGVDSGPTFLYFKKGQLMDRTSGGHIDSVVKTIRKL